MPIKAWFRFGKDSLGQQYIKVDPEVLMLVMDGSDIVFSVEESPATGKPTILLPGGMIEAGETPERAANRELQEELGYSAHVVTGLGALHPWSKYLNAITYICVGTGLEEHALRGDERSPISRKRVHVSDVDELIRTGELSDARAIAAIYLAQLHGIFGKGTVAS